MTPLISVESLIAVLVIEGLPGFKQAGNYPPSEAALGCKGRCFLQGRHWPPRSSPLLGVLGMSPRPWGGPPRRVAAVGLREQRGGKAWGEVGRLCYCRCVCGAAVWIRCCW